MQAVRKRIRERLRRLVPVVATAGLLLSGVAATIIGTSGTALAVGTYDNATIATNGLADLGQNPAPGGGQCKPFANAMVTAASAGTQHPSGYQSGWAAAGGMSVTSANAAKGDIIQITPAGSTDATAESLYDYSNPAKRLHTAIIVTNNGNDSFTVVDANFTAPNTVGEHTFDPYTWAAGSIVDIWRMGTVQGVGSSIHVASYASSDFNGDGVSDLVKFSAGHWYVFSGVNNSNGTHDAIAQNYVFGASGDIPLTGDFNGDGKSDYVLYRPSTGQWFVRASSPLDSPIVLGLQMGINCNPLVADYNGDGHNDFALDCGGYWYVFSGVGPSFTPLVQGFYDGTPNGIPVAGDFDGDGKADFASYNATNGVWNVYQAYGSYSAIALGLSMGGSGCAPLAGNFNGDAYTDYVVDCGGVWSARSGQGSSGYSYLFQGLSRGATTGLGLTGHFAAYGWNDLALSNGGYWDVYSGVNPFTAKFQNYQFGGGTDVYITG